VKAGFGRVERLREGLAARLEAKPHSRADAPTAPPLHKAPALRFRFELAGLFSPDRARRAYTEGLGDAAPDPAKIVLGGRSAQSTQSPNAARPTFLDGEVELSPSTHLGERLRHSAREIAERRDGLAAFARHLAHTIGRRCDGAVAYWAWLARFAIGLIWGLIAVQLVWAAFIDGPAFIFGVGRVAEGDIRSLAMLFGVCAAAATIVPFLAGAGLKIAGIADDGQVRRSAGDFGAEAAGLAKSFDKALDRMREDMEHRRDPVEAVADLSQAHLTALEAAVFYRDISFLTEETDAAQRFHGYVHAHTARPQSRALLAFLLGVVVGALLVILALARPVAVDLPATLLSSYPAAELWLGLGLLGYAFAGVIAEAFRNLIIAPASASACDVALDSARSGFVANNAPRVEDVIRRIENALELYKARVAQSRSAAQHADETPEWRKGPEAPRFVEAGFQAAPKPFLAVGEGPAKGKIRVRKSGPKRGGAGLE